MKLENAQRKHKKTKTNANWFVKNAEAIGIELDDYL